MMIITKTLDCVLERIEKWQQNMHEKFTCSCMLKTLVNTQTCFFHYYYSKLYLDKYWILNCHITIYFFIKFSSVSIPQCHLNWTACILFCCKIFKYKNIDWYKYNYTEWFKKYVMHYKCTINASRAHTEVTVGREMWEY